MAPSHKDTLDSFMATNWRPSYLQDTEPAMLYHFLCIFAEHGYLWRFKSILKKPRGGWAAPPAMVGDSLWLRDKGHSCSPELPQ